MHREVNAYYSQVGYTLLRRDASQSCGLSGPEKISSVGAK